MGKKLRIELELDSRLHKESQGHTSHSILEWESDPKEFLEDGGSTWGTECGVDMMKKW